MTPVTLYQSTDTDAPQLAKPTDPKSTQPCLLVDNAKPKFATLQPYQKMTAINQGTGLFSMGVTSYANYDKFGYINNQAQPKWWLIGHGMAFILMIKQDNNDISQMFYFGDVQGLGSNKTALYLTNSSGYEYSDSASRFYSVQTGSGNRGMLSRSTINNSPISMSLLTATDLISYRPPYPDPLTNGLIADTVHIVENQTNQNQFVIVAALTGLLGVFNDISKIAEGTQIKLDGDNDVWLKFSSAINQHFLINATQW